jgi:signal transduction histidine kinase
VTLAALLLVALAVAAALAVTRSQARRVRMAEERSAALETRVRELESAAADSHRGRNALLLASSHELRTPLAAIMGYQELLAEGLYGDLDNRTAEPVVRIGRAARHLLHLIDSLMEVACLQARLHLEREIAPVEVLPLLRDAEHYAHAIAGDRGVALEGRFPETLPLLETDRRRLVQILDLVVTAAVRASPGSSLVLGAAAEDGRILIRIEGTALPAGVPEPITDTPVGPGGGPAANLSPGRLRLSLAHELLRNLGGQLVVEPVDDTTTLHLRLPARAAAD